MASSFDDPDPPVWEPEPLHLPIELPPSPVSERNGPDDESDDAPPTGVIVIDLC